MQFTSMDSWKAQMKRYAQERNIAVTDLQQRYVLEEFAAKISKSKYKDEFVLKGGFVVANLLGIDWRTTRDIDMTFKSTVYSKQEIQRILEDIIRVEDHSFFQYEIVSIKEGQMDDGYSGFAVVVNAIYGKTKLPFKLDISNNTLIYPQAIENTFQSVFDGKDIQIMSYPIETIIAEKFETTLDRGEFNTRMRDLFDIALLLESQKQIIDYNLLAECILEVSKDRNTLENLDRFQEIISELRQSHIFNHNFEQYKNHNYPGIILTLDDIFEIFTKIQDKIQDQRQLIG